MDEEDTNIVNTPISERTEGTYKVPLFQIIFIEVGGVVICRGSVEGGLRLYMLLVDECNTDSNTQARGSGKDITGGKERDCVVMDPSSPHLMPSPYFHPVLSGATASNVKIFEGIPLLSYTLGACEKIFQVLEEEAQQTLMMLYEGTGISTGGVVKMTKRTVTFTEPAP